MAHDTKKWAAPTTGAEVAQAILDVRLALAHLYIMVKSAKNGEEGTFAAADAKFVELDETLRQTINRIGGIDEHASG